MYILIAILLGLATYLGVAILIDNWLERKWERELGHYHFVWMGVEVCTRGQEKCNEIQRLLQERRDRHRHRP